MRRERVKPLVSVVAVVALLAVSATAIIVGARVIDSVSVDAQAVSSLNELPEIPESIDGVAEWLPDAWDREREMEPATRIAIESAYVRAWLALSEYQLTGTRSVIVDSFSGPARRQAESLVADGATATVSVDHELELTFYALDGATVAFTDWKATLARSTVGVSGPAVVLTDEAYDVVMVLEDGYWRVRHLLRREGGTPVLAMIDDGDDVRLTGLMARSPIGVQPYNATTYVVDSNSTSADRARHFAVIKELGFSTVRVVVSPDSTSDSTTGTDLPEYLSLVLDDVHSAGLTAIVVVDTRAPATVEAWAEQFVEAGEIVESVAGHEAIVLWDLADRPDLERPRDDLPMVTAYLVQLGNLVREADPDTPITVTWSSIDNAANRELAALVDVISLRLGDAADVGSVMRELRGIGPVVSLVIDAPPAVPVWSPQLASEERQAAIAGSVLLDIRSADIDRWTFGELFDSGSSGRGLIDPMGEPRLVASLFAPDAELELTTPTVIHDLVRSPFWLAVLASAAILVFLLSFVVFVRIRGRRRSISRHEADGMSPPLPIGRSRDRKRQR
jgi:hypothetical protein